MCLTHVLRFVVNVVEAKSERCKYVCCVAMLSISIKSTSMENAGVDNWYNFILRLQSIDNVKHTTLYLLYDSV